MKIKLSIFTILFAICSCETNTNSKKENEFPYKDKSRPTTTKGKINSEETFKNNKDIWVFDYEKDFPVKFNFVNSDTLTPEKLVDIICKPKIHVDFIKVSGDTIYVKIKDSNYLTQSIGTTGAYSFMTTTTFTLTELNEINYVNFDFEAGDHASPGTYSRKYFEDERKSNGH